MVNKKYIMCSHVDWNRSPFGKVFFYQVFDAAGLQCGEYIGQAEGARQYALSEGLEAISPAKLLALWEASQCPVTKEAGE